MTVTMGHVWDRYVYHAMLQTSIGVGTATFTSAFRRLRASKWFAEAFDALPYEDRLTWIRAQIAAARQFVEQEAVYARDAAHRECEAGRLMAAYI